MLNIQRVCLLLAAGVSLLAGGCDQPSGGSRQIAGILFQEDQFFRLVEVGMREAATEAKVELSVNNSRNSLDEESRLIDTYRNRGFAAIVVSPLKSKASVSSLRRAHEKGIKIVTYNTALDADFPVCYIESNQTELGATTGKACRRYIEEKLNGRAKIAVISFVALDPESGGARVKGFLDEVRQLPGVEIVHQQDAWLPPEADNAVSSILTANPDLDIVWSANEGGTVGAVTAVRSAGKAGRVVVFGTDMSMQLADFLLADDQVLQALTAQKPVEIGKMAVEAAIDALDGKPLQAKVSLPGILFTREKPVEIQAYRKRLEQLTK